MRYFKKMIDHSFVEKIDDLFETNEERLYVKIPKELKDDCSQDEWIEACIDIGFWSKAIKKSIKKKDFDYKYFLDYN